MSKEVIAIDVGGTHFRSCLFKSPEGIITIPKREKTPNFLLHPELTIEQLQEKLIEKMAEVIKSHLKENSSISQVGISFPGPMTADGVVHQACTVWGEKGLNFPLLEKLIEKCPSLSITVANDITAAVERYAQMKEHANHDYIGAITVSSGIGSKIYDMKSKKVLLDQRGLGGEMGHIKIDFSEDALLCDCGGKGHVGAICSGRGIQRLAQKKSHADGPGYNKSYLSKLAGKPEDITTYHIIEALQKNDSFTTEILDETTYILTGCISQLAATIGVDKWVFVGGFALNCGQKYLDSLQRSIVQHDFYHRPQDEIPNMVSLGINDDNDCLVGIGLLAERNA